MSHWRQVQRELIQKAIHKEKSDITRQDVSLGNIHGTVYFKQNTSPRKGVLLVHGLSGNRLGLGELAQRLAEYGYFALSIDLPMHFDNPDSNISFGHVSELITGSIMVMKSSFGITRVTVIGHSWAGVAALFSAAGYNSEIENGIYQTWERIKWFAEHLENDTRESGPAKGQQYIEEIERSYIRLKEFVLKSLKTGMAAHSSVVGYVLLAPPANVKAAFPAIDILKKVKIKFVEKAFQFILDYPPVRQIYREGNPVGYVKPDDSYFRWQFFKTRDIHSFLEYVSKVKQPKDFLKLVEDIGKFRHKDGMINFFEYYLRNYLLSKPKLFIYGRYDWYLKPFMPGNRSRLERFYESCGNATIYYGSFAHVMMNNPKQQNAAIAVTDYGVTEMVIRFLENTGLKVNVSAGKSERKLQSFFGYFKHR